MAGVYYTMVLLTVQSARQSLAKCKCMRLLRVLSVNFTRPSSPLCGAGFGVIKINNSLRYEALSLGEILLCVKNKHQ